MPPYYTWANPALGASTVRTTAERLSDVVNVKDWGAKGDGSHIDAPNIQNAINFCMSTKDGTNGPLGSKGGKVVFPPGQYNLGSTRLVVGSSDPSISVSLVGGGGNPLGNTVLNGNVADYIISQGGELHDNLVFLQGFAIVNNSNDPNSGCVKTTGTCVYIQGCSLSGWNPIRASEGNGVCIQDCNGNGNEGHRDAGNTAPILAQSAVGMYLGNNCLAIDCRFTGGLAIGYALSGTGCALIGTSSEVLNTAVRVGWGPSGEKQCIGAVVQGFQTERCDVNLDIYNATACVFEANQWTGPNGVPGSQNIVAGTGMVWSSAGGGTVEVTTVAPHNLFAMYDTKTHKLQLDAVTNSTTWTNGKLFVDATVTASNKFTYPGPSTNPGAMPAAPSWTYPIHYGIRFRKVHGCVILTNQNNPNACIASMDMQYDGEAVHTNNMIQATGGGTSGWILPTSANRASWKFLDCGVASVAWNSEQQAFPSPYGIMNFADLPGQSGVNQPGPFEDQEYSIKDAQVVAVGSIVTGGGAQHYRVRYDGTNWTRVG